MLLHELKPPKGAIKRKKLLGRGPGSGHGKTSTRGSKGQLSRSGHHFYLGFEGGQMPLIERIPKRGFRVYKKNVFQLVNLKKLDAFPADSSITPETLEEKGLIHDAGKKVKILGTGAISKKVNVEADAFSGTAGEAITKAGGKITLRKKCSAL